MLRKLLIFTLVLVCSAVALRAQDLEWVLRDHYIGKYVVVKIPLPTARNPMQIYPERAARLDVPLYGLKIERDGVGLEPGEVAIIRNVEIDRREVTFDLVGVGFEMPPGRVAVDLMREVIWGQGGSRITLVFEEEPSPGDGLISEINSGLSAAVNTRALVSDYGLPPEMREAIRNGIVTAGMNHRAVYIALGEPTEILRELSDGRMLEAWLYEREDFTTLLVLFREGLVSVIREY